MRGAVALVGARKARMLARRLEDERGKKVVFLSHCILNENTRYPGGAGRAGCVREIVEQCMSADIGMVQMPCPEQQAWGGVIKRSLLAVYGTKGKLPYSFLRFLLPLFLAYTRFVYRRLARRTADQIEDYLDSGFSVVGVVGIDGSPSCGVAKTLDIHGSLASVTRIDVESITVDEMNAIVRRHLKDGSGMYTAALKEELEKRHLDVPFLAHDLISELDGKRSKTNLLQPESDLSPRGSE